MDVLSDFLFDFSLDFVVFSTAKSCFSWPVLLPKTTSFELVFNILVRQGGGFIKLDAKFPLGNSGENGFYILIFEVCAGK